MATDADFSAIVKVLNGVRSAGQARAAAGAALNAVHKTYPLLDRLTADRARAGRTELDAARTDLQLWYDSIKAMSAAAAVDNVWATSGRRKVERCYLAIAGVEGTANYVPQTSNLQILGEAIAAAPKVFVSAVGQAAGAVAKEAGSVVGEAAGGIFSGLGVSGTITLVVIGLVVLAVLKRGSLLGLLGKVAA